jgi:hypothetical protein
MDDATRLCLDADLMMALSPLTGHRDSVVARLDASMRATAVMTKYIDAAMATESYSVEHTGEMRFTITARFDPSLIDELRHALERAMRSLDD